jgi:hypothetical protein
MLTSTHSGFNKDLMPMMNSITVMLQRLFETAGPVHPEVRNGVAWPLRMIGGVQRALERKIADDD